MRKLPDIVLLLLLCQLLKAQLSFGQLPIDSIYTSAEQMPFFIGCDHDKDNLDMKRTCSNDELVRFLSFNLVYPDKAKHNGTEGTVFVSFIIDKEGNVNDSSILMDIGDSCGEAALAVINLMPKWEPAQHLGKPVAVKMNLPIQFYLRAENRDRAERYSLRWGSLRGEIISKESLQDNISKKIYVRGPEGENLYVDEISFVYQKDNRIVSASSRGEISSDMKRVIGRVKKGGTFTIEASVQDQGKFVSLSKTYQIRN